MTDAAETMTAYMCEAHEVCDRRGIYSDPPEAPEWFKPIDVVIAPTRGKAKRFFADKYSWHIEYTDVRTTKLRDGEDGPARIVEQEDPRHYDLWYLYERNVNPDDDELLAAYEEMLDEHSHELIATFGDLD